MFKRSLICAFMITGCAFASERKYRPNLFPCAVSPKYVDGASSWMANRVKSAFENFDWSRLAPAEFPQNTLFVNVVTKEMFKKQQPQPIQSIKEESK